MFVALLALALSYLSIPDGPFSDHQESPLSRGASRTSPSAEFSAPAPAAHWLRFADQYQRLYTASCGPPGPDDAWLIPFLGSCRLTPGHASGLRLLSSFANRRGLLFNEPACDRSMPFHPTAAFAAMGVTVAIATDVVNSKCYLFVVGVYVCGYVVPHRRKKAHLSGWA